MTKIIIPVNFINSIRVYLLKTSLRFMKNDQYFMSLALQEAKKAKSVGEVPVGCIIADSDGKIASKGHNLCEKQNDPTAHAEIVAIRKLSKKTQSWRLEGKSIYCTLQPCLMCMGAIVNSRIERLVYGTDDPRLLEINYIYELEDIYPPVKKLQITKNILKEDCAIMLKEFFSTLRT